MQHASHSPTAIGARIGHIRRAQKLTQEELSRVTGLSRETIVRVEAGRNLTLQSFAVIARALGASANYLLFGSRIE